MTWLTSKRIDHPITHRLKHLGSLTPLKKLGDFTELCLSTEMVRRSPLRTVKLIPVYDWMHERAEVVGVVLDDGALLDYDGNEGTWLLRSSFSTRGDVRFILPTPVQIVKRGQISSFFLSCHKRR